MALKQRIARVWFWIEEKWATLRGKHLAIDAAIVHFKTRCSKPAIRSMTIVIGVDSDGRIVRVCSGRNRPPWRKFYAVRDAQEGIEVEELTIDRAASIVGV